MTTIIDAFIRGRMRVTELFHVSLLVAGSKPEASGMKGMDVIKEDFENTLSEGQLSGISSGVAQSISQILLSLFARLSLQDRLPDGKNNFHNDLGNGEMPRT